ncbi:MAG: tRNA preQ1(34) S-adenosylmethionine ribosyltransferase-isomerase QueA [Candidatus Latescibacteria bacterium]|nr:tRNA preQ1(34) S-adenosylmethionine ribosyltransferase-isomerase QueA [Candidatus Latescibacterota bacterium]NIM66507.1 tRNA preQ1(34) S-adenosylmethionine ribosyltransferase-isomerase QueA [Candidatus Latescibacterota bacterium]NIO02987.1 tRNA preQ1(34) S-adenosylmethionine ribosyltransferase-isomerase QueA [Candidatus Latescibacterota bacterium]NIO30122.1 tRNA preQ1(34) S-adenosylmethionine ribosyltransferase-isomerase QueA [Candidatus Latescibacterota bacterium]NIO57741.1 tRNA preQ1(34) S
MRLDDFSYDLPESFIAQKPLEERDSSRLMVVEKLSGTRMHAIFRDLPDFLSSNDIVVVNRSRVVPARLFVRRESGGLVEVLFTRSEGKHVFRALVRSSKKPKIGEILRPEDQSYELRVEERVSERETRLSVVAQRNLDDILDEKGHVPLPPYIRRSDEPEDRTRYQTIFAKEAGSVAAPTAGLHFDTRLLNRLHSRGIDVLSLVLHVGPGTFLPLDREIVEQNRLDSEAFSISGKVLQKIKKGKAEGKRIVAVGTTVTRLLETAHIEGLFDKVSLKDDYDGETDLFIYPGFEFHVVDRLITNFHLPKSSLLLLVCAFLGREKTLACYNEAVARGYRFYSYGDAMLIG